MAKLRKNVDKGIAYLKKNGIPKTAGRLCRKILLSRQINYERFLQKHRRERQKRLQEQAAREKQEKRHPAAMEFSDKRRDEDIYIVVSGKLPQHIQEAHWYLFLNEGDRLEKDAGQTYAEAIRNHPGAELFYCDSDELSADGKHVHNPQCKPDFDAYYLQSTDYIGGGFLVSGRLVKELGAPQQLYEYLLRCTELTDQIVRVPEILYHQRKSNRDRKKADQSDAGALQSHLNRLGIDALVTEGLRPGTRKITYRYEERPLVSILIPNKDHKEDLKNCIDSIVQCAGYEPYEILILENNSTSEEIFSYYAALQKSSVPVRVLTYEGDFHYSKINNFGAKEARGDYLLFLNNDTRMIVPGCVAELMNYALRPDVGAVGTQMFYEDDTIQHAGIILGYGGIAGHAFEGTPRQQAQKIAPIVSARRYSAVTAACMMVRRSVFEELGGFDEQLAVAYNDVDLCLRIGKAGKSVIYTPYAQLYHYESRTRGLELTSEKAARIRRETEIFQKRWRNLLDGGDPCYNPNLTLERPDFSLRTGRCRK